MKTKKTNILLLLLGAAILLFAAGCDEDDKDPHLNHNPSDYCDDCLSPAQILVPTTEEGLGNPGTKYIDLVFPVGLKGTENATRRNVIINRFTTAVDYFDENAEVDDFKTNVNALFSKGFKIFIKETGDLADTIKVNNEFQFTAGTAFLVQGGAGWDELVSDMIAGILVDTIRLGKHLPPPVAQ